MNVILLLHQADGVRQRALSRFAGQAKRAVGLSGEVAIVVRSNRDVQRLNHRFRGQNKATDVLSFPSSLPGFAGDIAISAELAAANAGALGHSVETELKVLILHGLLHLAGYDHENDAGEMKTRETALRHEFKLPLGLIERTHAGAAKTSAHSKTRPPDRRTRKGRT
jgi:probable rRNA maturation factor